MQNLFDFILGVLKDFGAPVTVVLVGAYVQIKLSKLGKQRDEQFKKLEDVINKNHIIDTAVKVMNKTPLVIKYLAAINKELTADSSGIVLIHNGGAYATGESIIKLSIYAEEISPNSTLKRRAGELIKNTPITQLGDYVKRVKDYKWYLTHPDQVDNPILREVFIEWGITENFNIPLLNKDGLMFGILIVNSITPKEEDFITYMNSRTFEEAAKKYTEGLEGLINLLLE